MKPWAFAVAWNTAAGVLDPTLDGDGKLTTDFGTSNDHGYGVIVDGFGRIVVAGHSNVNGRDDFALTR